MAEGVVGFFEVQFNNGSVLKGMGSSSQTLVAEMSRQFIFGLRQVDWKKPLRVRLKYGVVGDDRLAGELDRVFHPVTDLWPLAQDCGLESLDNHEAVSVVLAQRCYYLAMKMDMLREMFLAHVISGFVPNSGPEIFH